MTQLPNYNKTFVNKMASVSLPNLEWLHFYCFISAYATRHISIDRPNNFPKKHAKRSNFSLKVGKKYLFRPMDRFFCEVILGQSYGESKVIDWSYTLSY